jgi:hypothetical protein
VKLMRDGKELLGGHRSKAAAVRALLAEGLTSRQIADRLGIKFEHVCSEISKARKKGGYPARRRARLGDGDARKIAFPLEDLDRLKLAAERRGLSINRLVQWLVEIIADERLVDAILDDGVLGEEPALEHTRTNGRANHGAA